MNLRPLRAMNVSLCNDQRNVLVDLNRSPTRAEIEAIHARLQTIVIAPVLRVVTDEDIESLRYAIEQAAIWRGSKRPEEWPEFDKEIGNARVALELIMALRRAAL